MFSILQVKEGRRILEDINDKASSKEMSEFIKTFEMTETGVNFLDGKGNPVLFIPVLGRKQQEEP